MSKLAAFIGVGVGLGLLALAGIASADEPAKKKKRAPSYGGGSGVAEEEEEEDTELDECEAYAAQKASLEQARNDLMYDKQSVDAALMTAYANGNEEMIASLSGHKANIEAALVKVNAQLAEVEQLSEGC